MSKVISSLYFVLDVCYLFEARVLSVGHGTLPTEICTGAFVEVYTAANSVTLASNLQTTSSPETTITTSLC
jgi:hypothetical protein